MKNIILCILLIGLFESRAQDQYYYLGSQKIYLNQDKTSLLVRVPKGDTLTSSFVKSNIESDSSIEFYEMIDPQARTGIIHFKSDTTKRKGAIISRRLRSNKKMVRIHPIYLDKLGGPLASLTETIIVGLKDVADENMLLDIQTKYNLVNRRKYKYDDKVYFLDLKPESDLSSIDVANRIFELGHFNFVEPNFLHFVHGATADPLFGNQYSIINTGQNGGLPGADMKVSQAWSISNGTGVNVAIIDVGVELTHPDLASNLILGFDATGNGSQGAPSGNVDDGAPIFPGGTSHGTAVAGIVAAIANNNIGTAGVAYNSKIIPIRMANHNRNYGITETDNATSSVDWARTNGADIINMSFSLGPQTSLFNYAIRNAVTLGRIKNGIPLGCVVFASTGNENVAQASYPSILGDVIAVGASNRFDTRWIDTGLGSNYGSGLDVVAPGSAIATTDQQGTAGYNTSSGSSGDYIVSFTGTSAASPNAAGVMALILSANPLLSQVQARSILELTCSKTGPYSYSQNVQGQPNGTWSVEMGYGRVNACLAVTVTSIKKNIPPAGIAICSSWNFAPFTIPPGVVISWTTSVPSGLQINSSGVASRVSNFSGPATITASVSGACGSWIESIPVYVGVPDRPGSIIGNTSPSVGSTEFYYSPTPAVGSTSYSWSLPNGFGCTDCWSISSVNTDLSIYALVGSDQGFVQVISRNSCGAGGAAKLFVSPVGTGGCNPCQIGVNPFPNPVDKELHVGLGGGHTEKSVRLINSNQEIIFDFITDQPSIVIQTGLLLEGVYYLNLRRGTLIEEHRIIVKH